MDWPQFHVRSAITFVARSLFVVGGLGFLLKGFLWLLNFVGFFQTGMDVLAQRVLIVNWIVTISQAWPIGVFALGVFVLACIHFGSPKVWIAKLWTRPPESQEIFVAVDQLKALLADGTAMETAFQIPNKPNPKHSAVHNWIDRVNECARQKALAGIVGLKEVKRLNTPWHLHDVRRVESLLEQVGYFDGVDDVGRLTFRTIWGHIKRLEELIDLIEGAPETERPTLGHVPSGAIGAIAKSDIHERAAALIQLVDRRVQRINQLLEKDTPLLDAIANFAQDYKEQAERDAGFAELFEVDDDIIQAARKIDLESNWESFGELCQLLITLNTKVRDYNQNKVANLKNQVLHWSFQKVPEKLRDAKQELLSKRLW